MRKTKDLQARETGSITPETLVSQTGAFFNCLGI